MSTETARLARLGLPGWVFVGVLVGVGAYGGLLVVALLDPRPDNLGALVVAPVLLLLTVPIAIRLARADEDPGVVGLVLVAVVLKLAASLLRYYTAIDLYGGLADASAYHNAGALFAPDFRSLHFDVASGDIPGTGFVEVVTGAVYAITGVSRLTGFFVFAWLSMLGQILCWRAFKIGVPDGDSRRYALLVLFFPTMLYWPSSIGKDAWMILTIGLTAYGMARLLQRRSLGITLTAVGVAGLTMVRPHIALIMLGSVLVALILRRPTTHSTLGPVLRLASIGVVVAITLVVASQAEALFNVQNLDQETVATTLSTTVVTSTGQGGSAFTPVVVDTPLDMPLATVTVLFRPLPFEAGNAQMLATSVEGLILAALCVFSWRRLATIPRRLRSTPYVALALVFVLLFVYLFSAFANFGILARQRTQVLPFLFVLLALPALRQPRAERRAIDAGYAAAAPATSGRFDRWTRTRAPGVA